MTVHPPSEESLAQAFKALAEEVRLRILAFLRNPEPSCCRLPGEVCACDLEAYLHLSQPTVSHHMARLVQAGLVRAEKRGRHVFYRLNPESVLALAQYLKDLALKEEP